ncbi:MAG: hypothetical protein DRP71_05875 [Verrucomicrobia bacterium]|nr:MAG: hypothetical protein DRP71_05875 [Verrucomicrobiota bacterium]
MMQSSYEWLGQRWKQTGAPDKHVLENTGPESIGKADDRMVRSPGSESDSGDKGVWWIWIDEVRPRAQNQDST